MFGKVLGLSMVLFSGLVSASGVGDIAAGVSFTDVSAALITVFTAVGAVYIVLMGARMIVGALRGR